MFYDRWMSFIKDDVKLCNVVIPGSHDAGTYVMNKTARCQDGTYYEQFLYGSRYFDTRFHIAKNGVPTFEHGIISGSELENGLRDIRRMINHNDSEFFIFKIWHFTSQRLGPIHLKFKRHDELVDKLIEEYLEPEKYAFTDFDRISDVTMGDIRASGKRYILNREEPDFIRTVNTPLYMPWTPKVHGMKPRNFMKHSLKFFDEMPDNCLFNFQTQRTPNLWTQEGVKWPRRLDREFTPYYKEFIDKIADTPELLEKVNIISCDFITENYKKSNYILALNLLKDNVKEAYVNYFLERVNRDK